MIKLVKLNEGHIFADAPLAFHDMRGQLHGMEMMSGRSRR
jgi:hypothetical protein